MVGLAIGLAIVLLATRIKSFQAIIATILIILVLIVSVVITIYMPGQDSETTMKETPSPPTTPIPQIPPTVIPSSPTPTPQSTILIWQNIYGGLDDDAAYSVQQTADGGYIIAGESDSYGKSGSTNAYLVKTDSKGNEQWSQTFGGLDSDAAHSVQQTTDGGYIIAGYSYSYGKSGSGDAYLVKTDSEGNEQWSQTFGGLDSDYFFSVRQTTDGGYIIAGHSYSYGKSGSTDAYLVKTDSEGNEQWSQTFGGLDSDYFFSVRQTTDGGYIIAGESDSYGKSGSTDAYLVKTDSEGNEQWSQNFGGLDDDGAASVQQTAHGRYRLGRR